MIRSRSAVLALALALATPSGCSGSRAPFATPAAAPAATPAATSLAPRGAVDVALETARGTIVVRVDLEAAPATARNFLRHVDAGLYDGGAGTFYRTVVREPDNQPSSAVKIEVIQGGLDVDELGPFPPIEHETTARTGLRHLDGTISMARLGPGTASSEFFICVGPQPELDFGGARNPDGQGFAAFGRVVRGMDVVRAIHRAPQREQRLDPPVPIVRARRAGQDPPAS